jgi:transcriptional regulator with XRE-family HTH domain
MNFDHNKKHMPTKAPAVEEHARAQLEALGAQIRAERKALRLSSTTTAEAAGISRVTLHRIEKGESSVAIAAWANVVSALGLTLTAARASEVRDGTANRLGESVPVHIRLADYPQLKALAWHVQGTDILTPAEALAIYERNARHLNLETMSIQERGLLEALRAIFRKNSDV